MAGRSYPAPAARKRTPAWCSTVSAIARSACRSARSGASGACASGAPSAPARNACAASSSRQLQASHAMHTTPTGAAPQDHARRAAEAGEVVVRPAGGARREVRREAGGEQQLEAEGELVGARRAGRLAVEQRELVAQQVVDLGMGLAGLEEA